MSFSQLNTTSFFYWNPELFRILGKEVLGKDEPRDCFFQAVKLSRGEKGSVELECVKNCGMHDSSVLCWSQERYDKACEAFWGRSLLVPADSMKQFAAIFAAPSEKSDVEIYDHESAVETIFSLLNQKKDPV